MVTAIMTFAPWKKSYNQPRQHIKKQRHYFDDKGLSSQSYGVSSSHVRMWELDHKEVWVSKNWCFWNLVLEKTLESPLDNKEIKPVNPKGNQPWIFIGRTDAEAPVFWPPLKSGGEEDNRRCSCHWNHWHGWMASQTQWTWVWANCGRWWRTRKFGVLQSTGSVAKSWTWLRD